MRRLACFTDLHLGRKQNSIVHARDCLDFIDWFSQLVQSDPGITDIVFLGDYFESRSTISIQTLDFAYAALKRLNQLGKPIWFIVGNHDLYRRSTREIYSTSVFQELSNVQVISEPIITDGILFSPYLFHDEYERLDISGARVALGHFEFKGFAITGYNTIMDRGPDHRAWSSLDLILSGHFHKRQVKDNVIFIGNCFPMDFGDVNDVKRGACVVDLETRDVRFYNWEACPKYVKTTLSAIISGGQGFLPKTQVKCVIDQPVSYSEAQLIREAMVEEFNLRDFILEDDALARQELLSGETDVVAEDYNSIDEMVVNLLDSIQEAVVYDPKKLVKIYKEI